MIFIATDFGLEGPYIGQVKASLVRAAPAVPVIDLFADLPMFQPKISAYLLAAYAGILAPGDVLLAVVDPGVGSNRRPMMMHADDRWYVGPDNGLFELIRRRAVNVECSIIDWRPDHLSSSFHGRDLFAPVAARLAIGMDVAATPMAPEVHDDWPDDLSSIVYIDIYGNGMSGLRAKTLPDDSILEVAGASLKKARTFSDCPPGTAFWYENANGLLEIAVNGGSAAECFDLHPGFELSVRMSG